MSLKYEDSFSFHRLFCRHRKREVYRAEPVFRSFNLIELSGNSNYVPDVCRPDILERIEMPTISPQLLPVLMLFASNVFMTFAWYGHLKFKESPLALAIMVSWGIALFEYSLAVPANRWGNAVYSAAQLKTMQEVITLVVFSGFSVLVLKEPLGWNDGLGFALIAAGAFFIFHKW
jgi:uncharacterized protein (DUF486 family)